MSVAASTLHIAQSSSTRIACALGLFAAALGLYLLTLAPTATLVDSGELILAAHSLGVAHPPGFPLYVLLAHLATLVPIGNVAARVNFASALFAALACSTVALVVMEAMVTPPRSLPAGRAAKKAERKHRSKKGAAPPGPDQEPAPKGTFALASSCLVAGLLLAFSRTLWAYATIAEVYSLNSLLILLIFLLMFRWRREVIASPSRQSGAALPHGSLYAAAFLFGLALGVHHVSVALMLPAFAALVFATEGLGFFASRRFAYAALFGFAGLFLVYAYLPLAAARSPIMNWGDPRTLERLWREVTGSQYQGFLAFSLQTMASQFVDFIKMAAHEFGPWQLPAGLALAVAGLAAVFRRDKALFWFLALVIAADLTYSLGYQMDEDKDAYYLPAFLAMTIAAGFGAEWIIHKVVAARPASKAARPIALALVLLAPAAALAGNWPYDNRSRYFIAQDYVENIFSTIEPGGMLLTRDWQVYSPTLYFQTIEHRRSDAVIIDINQLRRSWYFEYLRQVYPATIAQSADKVDAFLEDLRRWERDPELYVRDRVLNQRINSRFFEMILAFVSTHLRSAPVYVTLDIAGNRDGPDAELTRSLSGLYQFVPQGLVFEMTTDRAFRQPADPPLLTRGLADGTIAFDDVDVVQRKVLPAYVSMFYSRGRYLAANGRHAEAITAFQRSLALNSRFAPSRQAMEESFNAIRESAAGEAR